MSDKRFLTLSILLAVLALGVCHGSRRTLCLVNSDDAATHSSILLADYALSDAVSESPSPSLQRQWDLKLVPATRSTDLIQLSGVLRAANCSVVVGPGTDSAYFGNASASVVSGKAAKAYSIASVEAVLDWGSLSREMADRREFPNYHRVRSGNFSDVTLALMRLFGWRHAAVVRPAQGIDVDIRSSIDVEAELVVSTERLNVVTIQDFIRSIRSPVVLVYLPAEKYAHSTVSGTISRMNRGDKVFVFFSVSSACNVKLPGSLCLAHCIDDPTFAQAEAFARNRSREAPFLASTGWDRRLFSLSKDYETVVAADAIVHAVRTYGSGAGAQGSSRYLQTTSDGTGLTGAVNLDEKGERIFAATRLYNTAPDGRVEIATYFSATGNLELLNPSQEVYWPGGYGDPPSSAVPTGSDGSATTLVIVVACVFVLAMIIIVAIAAVLRRRDRHERQEHYFEQEGTGVFLFAAIPLFSEIEKAIGSEAMGRVVGLFRSQLELLAKRHRVCLVKIVDQPVAFLASTDAEALVQVAIDLQLALFASDWSFALDLEPFYRERDAIASDEEAINYGSRWNGLRVQCGLASGPFQFLETPKEVDYVGDAVNIASRVAVYAAHPGQIVITSTVKSLLPATPAISTYTVESSQGTRALPGIVSLVCTYVVVPTVLEARQAALMEGVGDSELIKEISDAAADFIKSDFYAMGSSDGSHTEASTMTGAGL